MTLQPRLHYLSLKVFYKSLLTPLSLYVQCSLCEPNFIYLMLGEHNTIEENKKEMNGDDNNEKPAQQNCMIHSFLI